MEILDNIAHDRLWREGDEGKWTHQTRVHEKDGSLEEIAEPLTDELCQQFNELYQTMPLFDHISAKRELLKSGVIERMIQFFKR